MKTTTTAYRSGTTKMHIPNAATRREILHKFVDLLIVGAIGAAFAAMLLLLIVLG